ncbi:hypothetical protein K3N28_23060, partial [Glycomyces sp. TRM65418]|uniref:hypothetical protein n=1 Tax=Glycomyces sp. TRM65418 TaxID=2867006 RepID=UPI001D162802
MSTTPPWSARINRVSMRLLQIGIVTGLLLLLVTEMVSHGTDAPPPMHSWVSWLECGVSLFVIAVYCWYRPGRKRWIGAASIASLAATGLDFVYDQGVRGVGTAELLALGLLMLFAVRHWDAPPGRWVAFSTGAAVMLIGVGRLFGNEFQEAAIGGTILVFMAMTTV